MSKTSFADALRDQAQVLEELLRWCRAPALPSGAPRLKVEALAAAQAHLRDAWADVCRSGTGSGGTVLPTDFCWLRLCRAAWRQKVDDTHGPGSLVMSIGDAAFSYGYEYLGIVGARLVATPLTDRVFLALTQAVAMHQVKYSALNLIFKIYRNRFQIYKS